MIRRRILLFIAVMSAYAVMAWASVAFGQSIIGPDQVATCTPVWLSLELPEGVVGSFDAKERSSYTLDADPAHVAPGAALFWATAPGEYEITAAVNGEAGPTFFHLTITVKGGGENPPPSEAITAENVAKWLAEVPESARSEVVTNPVTDKQMSRQQAVGQTFINIANAGPSLGSTDAMDNLLSAALVSALGDSASDWQPFANQVDAALAKLKRQGTRAAEYAEAFTVIGRALADG